MPITAALDAALSDPEIHTSFESGNAGSQVEDSLDVESPNEYQRCDLSHP